jgi:hypothetical protein
MAKIISRCNSCGKFLDSKRELREHIDKNHRITNSKMMMIVPKITKHTAAKSHYQQENG